MPDVHPEAACHTADGLHPILLQGGPWDGKVVGVRVENPPLVRVHGPRHGDHTVWISHLYESRGGRYEYASTEEEPLSASNAWSVPSSSRMLDGLRKRAKQFQDQEEAAGPPGA